MRNRINRGCLLSRSENKKDNIHVMSDPEGNS